MIDWPVVRRYDGESLRRIAMPVGGIGTGSISLGGRGQLMDWELFNRPAKGFDPQSFFSIRVDGAQGTETRVLEGPLDTIDYEGHLGSPVPVHGLPRFRTAGFAAAYPFGQVTLTDPDLPVVVTVGAFNPLVPGDPEASGLPALVYRVRVENTSTGPLAVDLAGNLLAVVGHVPHADLPEGNRFERVDDEGLCLLVGRSTRVADDAEAWGSIALAVLDHPVSSSRLTWARRTWGDSLLDYWDDFGADGQLDEPHVGARVPTGSLVVHDELAPGESAEVTFVIAWHFPNRRGWSHSFRGPPDFGHSDDIVGNHYARLFTDAEGVVRHLARRLDDYEARTIAYVETVTTSDLPRDVQDAVLSNVAVLKSTTCFRIADGTFLAWEGSNRDHGSCHGSCTHVWNYQYALEQLFPDLAWSMREVELLHSLDVRGLMSFRSGLPLATEGTGWRIAAADGQMGALVRLHRTWVLSGGDAQLRRLWPQARRAMEFAWIVGGWDADQDGVMEGCQHNTMDVELFGPSGVNQSWYLAALAACAAMAKSVGDTGFAQRCADLGRRGAAATDEELFNGSYYQQTVLPPASVEAIADGLRIRYADNDADMGSDDVTDPDFQIGAGCTTDQLAGHVMGLLGGLVDGLDARHVRTAMRSVVTHNHRDGFHTHVNHLRSYALGSERGLVNCTYPRGGRPLRPLPYCHEVWTGFEYTAAVGLAALGDHEVAGRIVTDVRDRHDGRSRNPFNEVECGNHYVRSMASFGLAHAWSRAVVDAGRGVVVVDPVPGRWPVIAGGRLGHVEVSESAAGPVARYHRLLGDALEVEIR